MKKFNIRMYKGIGDGKDFIGFVVNNDKTIAEETEESAKEFIEKMAIADYIAYVSIITIRCEKYEYEIYSFSAHQKKDIYFVATEIK